jgi:hypothetical protein
MLDDLLEANLIELLELKRSEKVNQMDNPNYCKYHRLINHFIKKCFVLKNKIMRLHESVDIFFYNEITSFNIIVIGNLGSHQSLLAISFGYFELMILDILLLISFTTSLSQVLCITIVKKISDG